jgi:hypothetical protein
VSGGRGAPRTFLASRASSRALFATGAALLPAFLLQQDLVLRALLVVVFLGLNAVSGRKVRLLQSLLVGAGIVALNLVIREGKVLAVVAGLPLTELSLKAGVLKASAMVGLIALSRFSVRSDLRVPGTVGSLLGTSLVYFERIMGARHPMDRRDVIGSIDAILLSAHDEPSAAPVSCPRTRTSIAGGAVLTLVLLASWGALGWTLIHPSPFWG